MPLHPLRGLAFALAVSALAACGGGGAQPAATTTAAAQAIQINGAGATFPYPIYSKWFAEYNTLHPEVRINYQSIGSGGGIRQLLNQTVFFGATDGPMTDEQLKSAPGPILHLPMVLGAVVPVYNVPGIETELKFTGAVLADMYLGKIKKWNDPALARMNPGVKLPASDVTIVHRSDGSGTTYIFVDYLSKVSPEFKTKVGVNTSVNWPVGVGGKGNEGVSGLVSQTPGSMGYVELIYASQNKIKYGSVQNASGQMVKATTESVSNAATVAAASMPADFRVSITNADGLGAYPISSFTWLLVFQQPADKASGKALTDFVRWALTDGQKYCADLGYAPLPPSVVRLETAALDTIPAS